MTGRGALLALALFGCAPSGAGLDALPAAPIAFVFRTVEETERMLDEVEAKQKAGSPGPEDEFTVKLEGLEKLAGRRTAADVARDELGSVAIYTAPEKRLELPEALARRSLPLDWSADHASLMFRSSRGGVTHLFEWIPASGEVRQLTTGFEAQIDGCYGPDGAIAWVQVEKASIRIWVRRRGEPALPVSDGPRDLQPAWSPDGTRVVFTADDGKGGLALRWLDPLGHARGELGRGRSADFSPDGEWIVYSARSSAGWRLWRMRRDGSGKRSLGSSGFEENHPSVSPDGRYVVFEATKGAKTPTSRLFVRSFDGSVDRQLEFGGSGLVPVW